MVANGCVVGMVRHCNQINRYEVLFLHFTVHTERKVSLSGFLLKSAVDPFSLDSETLDAKSLIVISSSVIRFPPCGCSVLSRLSSIRFYFIICICVFSRGDVRASEEREDVEKKQTERSLSMLWIRYSNEIETQ